MNFVKNWEIKKKLPKKEKDRYPELNPVALQLLYDRGLKEPKQIEAFLNPDYFSDVHDPYLLKNMPAVVDRIFKAIENKEKITVYGDYDADGVCSSVITVKTLEFLGADVDVYIPHREKEGYGLLKKSVDYIARRKTKLMITVDCGVSNAEEVVYAKEKGLDVIVTDHHEIPQNVPDCLLIHARNKGQDYPCPYLAGAGIAFKVCQALLLKKKGGAFKTRDKKRSKWVTFEKWLLDLVGIATVADMMPLLGENRVLVRYGLMVLNKARRPGMKYLLQEAGLWEPGCKDPRLSSEHIAFQIGPRINAAGRMDHANTAYKLLMSEDEEQARNMAAILNKNNIKRQKLVDRIYKEALNQIGSVKQGEIKILFAYDPSWSLGVAGLVANRILADYHLPVVIGALLEGRISASVRSIPAFDFVEALADIQRYFYKYGGHAMACGFTLKNNRDWLTVREKLNLAIKNQVKPEDIVPTISVDMEIALKEVNWELIRVLNNFEPFGKANPKPVFLTSRLLVQALEAVGSDNRHLRLILNDQNGTVRKGIGFCLGNWCREVSVGQYVDVVYEVGVNRWNGRQELQLGVLDLRLSQ